MPITEHRREYLRKYQLAWVTKRRRSWIRANGPCARCGSIRKLEVDHVDPETKEYEAASIWSLSVEKRTTELAKCQVLCRRCHAQKSAKERHERGIYDRMRIKAPPGKVWCYRGKHFVLLAGFSKNAGKFDGRQDECRVCRSRARSKKGRVGLSESPSGL
jgi:hypothetical protein